MTTIMKRAMLALALILTWSVAAQAHDYHARGFMVPHRAIYGGFFYDPFWAPYYPYAVFPYSVYPYDGHPLTDVKVQVTPKTADVYVDGYYAGPASEFEGILKRLHATPGGHVISVHLDGYRTVNQHVYLAPGSTYTLHEALEKLAPGEVSAPVPSPMRKG
jgi:hypothetical protein